MINDVCIKTILVHVFRATVSTQAYLNFIFTVYYFGIM